MGQSATREDVMGETAPAAETESANSYDRLPHENRPLPATRPDGLATLAILAGLKPAPIATCRVLEIGCAVGGNLLPMAQSLPGSNFVGIDSSAKQIAIAQRTATGAGLTNVRLEVKDLTSITPDFGEFDYIIAHNVYSYVPTAVRERLLQVIAQNLSADGLAYLSYNVYPGWHTREMFREMVVSQVGGAGSDPGAAVNAAREHMALLKRYVAAHGQPVYAANLSREAAFVAGAPDDHVAHDYLEASGDAVYFQDFARELERSGLDYVGEARGNQVRQKLADTLRAEQPALAADWVRLEQTMDAIEGGLMRRSLLCRAGKRTERGFDVGRIEGLKIRATVLPTVREGDFRGSTPMPFCMPDGKVFEVTDLLAKATIIGLSRDWTRALTLEELLTHVRAELQLGEAFGAPGTFERKAVAAAVFGCYAAGIVGLHVAAPEYTLTTAEKPKATALARYQAREGTSVTNALHFLAVNLTKVQRLVLAHLNGARDRAALVAVLRNAIAKGVLPDPASEGGREAGFLGSLEESVGGALARLAADAFLVD